MDLHCYWAIHLIQCRHHLGTGALILPPILAQQYFLLI